MKVIHISDTHTKHGIMKFDFEAENADMIICSGDISDVGSKQNLEDFFHWFSGIPIKYKLVVGGNHDKSLDPKFYNGKCDPMDRYARYILGCEEWGKQLTDKFSNHPYHFYLNHESVEIEGIKFFGSPWSKEFHPRYWAFNLSELEAFTTYQAIPEDTDVIISHGPAYGFLDKTTQGIYTGSEILRETVKRIKPQYLLTGHIHEAFGMTSDGTTIYLNSSILDENYFVMNKPQVFHVHKRS